MTQPTSPPQTFLQRHLLLVMLGSVIFLLFVTYSCGGFRARTGTQQQPRPVTTAARQTPYQPPTMFANIKSWVPTETDCVNLQSWFNGADNMHGRVSGDLAAMQFYSGLMGQIDGRMETVGCYG